MQLVHEEPPRYRAYMLRMWEVRGEQPAQPSMWRFSLEDPETGKKRAFADLQALTGFLEAELGNERNGPADDLAVHARAID
jgi:hypothetical protein